MTEPERAGRAASRLEEHVGELQLALTAPTLEELFVEAARFVASECGPVEGDPGPWEPVEIEARDAATLLADWINELIGRSEVESRAYAEVRDLRLDGGRLRAAVRGRPVAGWESPLKAATYHGLEVVPADGGWRASVLLDV